MKLALDNIIFSLQHIGGVSNYWGELWLRFLRDKISVQAIENKDAINNFYRSKINISNYQILSDKRPINISRYLSAPVGKKVELFHSSYYRTPKDSSIPSIQSCYDFTYERFRTGPAKWIHSLQKRKAILSAAGIICISNNTRLDLHNYYPEIDPKNTCVIYLGYSNDFKTLQKKIAYKIISKYFEHEKLFSIFVGARDKYKNFFLAVDAISMYNNKHWLVFIGGGALSSTHFNYLNLKLKNRWLHINNVSNNELNALYNCAYSLLYPSSYEGFGIPVIEAMAAGCPVIAFKISSIPEVAGNAGIILDTIDALSVANELKKLENYFYRENICKKSIENSKRFSWENCFKKTIQFYSKVLNK